MTEANAANNWYVYVVRCADNSLYTGMTNDVVRRFREHQAQGCRTARYLRGRGPLELVFSCRAGDRGSALKLEYGIKRLAASDKWRLVSGQLPVAELFARLELQLPHPAGPAVGQAGRACRL